jgi:hypothetical protein
MAVIVSEEADEEKKFAKQQLTIKPHRERMNTVDEHGHDVEYNFKDPSIRQLVSCLRHVADRFRRAYRFNLVPR